MGFLSDVFGGKKAADAAMRSAEEKEAEYRTAAANMLAGEGGFDPEDCEAIIGALGEMENIDDTFRVTAGGHYGMPLIETEHAKFAAGKGTEPATRGAENAVRKKLEGINDLAAELAALPDGAQASARVEQFLQERLGDMRKHAHIFIDGAKVLEAAKSIAAQQGGDLNAVLGVTINNESARIIVLEGSTQVTEVLTAEPPAGQVSSPSDIIYLYHLL